QNSRNRLFCETDPRVSFPRTWHRNRSLRCCLDAPLRARGHAVLALPRGCLEPTRRYQARAKRDRLVFVVGELPRRDCLKPSAMLLTPWRLGRTGVQEAA